jgi:hypothetical protein
VTLAEQPTALKFVLSYSHHVWAMLHTNRLVDLADEIQNQILITNKTYRLVVKTSELTKSESSSVLTVGARGSMWVEAEALQGFLNDNPWYFHLYLLYVTGAYALTEPALEEWRK